MKAENKTYNLKDSLVIDQLYTKYWKLLYAICYKSTNDTIASEEIVQDVFIGLWKRGGALEVSFSIKSYLIKSAKTGIIKYYRTKTKNREDVFTACNLCEENEFTIDVIEHNEAITTFLEEDLQLVVNQLPCQCQKIYRLSRENQLNANEIAVALNLSPKTVKNHITKALSFIKKHIQPVISIFLYFF
ncbi:putative RNA polymerase sigma factor [Polaribacter irgensii 23-P]|uniref:Putative RNA polymerase sigma factor n=1 Tax=Polaribacter irgensii 23-P TaxID=313594 RepID=A4C0J4_9FLAO|nr:sigma-70 family RNA polymerase sigma factor [Polaribacter irgensii]EAR12937.1 putative RNA polymerase sigma factor [Polaribacter irgensii 23-P]